jgi:hypothetical protein
MYQSFYFFNLTNPDEVMDGAKPRVVEIGPYVYRRYESNFEITFPGNRGL